MCGRYRRVSDKQKIAEAFEAHVDLEELYLDSEDDIAPGSIQPVVRINQIGERQIEPMRWGFQMADRLLFNARSEGIASARFWKESFGERRCIVPADSFFEWEKVKAGKKPKFEFAVPGRQPFGMAGLWAPWRNPKTLEWENTFAIVTGDASSVVRPVHERQPAILKPADYAEYLAESGKPPLHLLQISTGDEMTSRLVGKDRIAAAETDLFGSL